MTTLADIQPVTAPADHMPGPAQGRWTYADYAALPNDENRYEIIDGVLFIAPAPTTEHQSLSSWLVYYLIAHIQITGLGRVFHAPTDVELAPNVVLQPDVLVVLTANQAKILPSRIEGAPDLVIEIVSPSSAGYDRREKQDAYAKAGVTEYWVADPSAQTVELLRLDTIHGAFVSAGVFRGQARLPSNVVAIPVAVGLFFA